MRILHTSDWHLGKKLENHSRLDEQKEVLDEIISIAETEDVDIVIIAGDLYDTFNPSVEAIELFYKTLKRLTNNGKRPVIAIAGNHDTPDRIEAPDPLARENAIFLLGNPSTKLKLISLDNGVKISKTSNGFIELFIPKYKYPLRLLLTPYANEFRLKKYLEKDDSEEELRLILQESWKEIADNYCDDKGVNIQVAHLFFTKKGSKKFEEPEDEKPILYVGGAQAMFSNSIPPQMQYVALGHLHRKHIIDDNPCPIVYSGSILPYSFSEANQDKFVSLIDAKPKKDVIVNFIKLSKGKRLLRGKFVSIDEAVIWLKKNENALVELTIVSEDYLKSDDRKLLNNVHNGIISIIPEISGNLDVEVDQRNNIDLNKNIDELFKEYFFQKNGQKPNEELIDLFKEVRNL